VGEKTSTSQNLALEIRHTSHQTPTYRVEDVSFLCLKIDLIVLITLWQSVTMCQAGIAYLRLNVFLNK